MNIVVHQLHLLPSRWLWSTLSPGFWRSCSSFCQGWSPFFVRWVPVTHHRHRLEHERPGTPVGSKRCDFQYDFHRFQCPSFVEDVGMAFMTVSYLVGSCRDNHQGAPRFWGVSMRLGGLTVRDCFSVFSKFIFWKPRNGLFQNLPFSWANRQIIKKIKAQLWPGTASRP